MRDPIRHLKALAFALTVFLIGAIALAQVFPQALPFMPYVWPYVSGGTLTYTGTDIDLGPAPPIALHDHRGAAVSLADQQGKLVLLTFLDPLCTDDCLLMAQQISFALSRLESDAQDVVVLAVNVNENEQSTPAMVEFLASQGLDEDPAWHFLGGDWSRIAEVIEEYHVSAGGAKPEKPDEIAHQDVVFVIDRQGDLRVLITYPTPAGVTLQDVIVTRARQLL